MNCESEGLKTGSRQRRLMIDRGVCSPLASWHRNSEQAETQAGRQAERACLGVASAVPLPPACRPPTDLARPGHTTCSFPLCSLLACLHLRLYTRPEPQVRWRRGGLGFGLGRSAAATVWVSRGGQDGNCCGL